MAEDVMWEIAEALARPEGESLARTNRHCHI
jgi:hypothetical protein